MVFQLINHQFPRITQGVRKHQRRLSVAIFFADRDDDGLWFSHSGDAIFCRTPSLETSVSNCAKAT